MVKIYLSINNNEEVMLLPVTPEEYEVDKGWDNEQVKGLYQTMNIIGEKELEEYVLESFFPVRDYPFLLNREMWGNQYVDTIERWLERKYPLRLVVINEEIPTLNINSPVTVERFRCKTGKDGDIYYTLELKEFKFIEV